MEEKPEHTKPKQKKSKIAKFNIALLVVFIAILVGVMGYFYSSYSSQAQVLSAEVTSEKSMLEMITHDLVIKTGENPVIAEVNNPNKLSTSTYFAEAQVGDKIVLYKAAKLVVLFRPSENKIINSIPLKN